MRPRGRPAAIVSTSTLDLDLGAVHVHLPVPDEVKPRPRKQRCPGRRVRRHGEVVVRCRQRATADHGFDRLESGPVVVGHRQLTGAAMVRGASNDGHAVRRPSRVRGCRLCGFQGVVALARIVGAISEQRRHHVIVPCTVRVLRIVLAPKGIWMEHLHMGTRQKGMAEEEPYARLHGGRCASPSGWILKTRAVDTALEIRPAG